MIYRALECGVLDTNDDSVDVWFSAVSDKEASALLPRLLSVGWHVEEERIYSGNIDGILDVERNSIQSPEAGTRRWYETGSWGNWPLYHRSTELVMLRSRDIGALYAAKAAAQMHARELAAQCEREIKEIQAGAPSLRRSDDLRYQQRAYQNFADEPAAYARARAAMAVPTAKEVLDLRVRHHMTQTEAARLIYVTPNAWQKWEKGDRRMDRRTWELLRYKLREDDL